MGRWRKRSLVMPPYPDPRTDYPQINIGRIVLLLCIGIPAVLVGIPLWIAKSTPMASAPTASTPTAIPPTSPQATTKPQTQEQVADQLFREYDGTIVYETPSAPRSRPRSPELNWVGIGEWITVGVVRWKVVRAEQASSISDSLSGSRKRPKGKRFVVVSFRAQLLGRETGTITSSQLDLVDQRGRIFAVDHDAMWALGQSFFLEQIHPGISFKGRVAFDVPAGSHAIALRIEDLRLLSDAVGFVGLGRID